MGSKPFISYSRQDFPFVRDLLRSLRDGGVEPWLDLTNVVGGDPWNDRIEKALMECSHCLVVMSPYSVKSGAVRREFEFALQHQKPVLPVLLQTTKRPEDLGSIQWIDFRVSYEKGLRILLARLSGGPLNAEQDFIEVPPRPISFFGFVPMFYIACPTVVKIVSALIFINGFFKFGFGYFIHDSDDGIVMAGVEILVSVSCMWWTFRAANRRSTFVEMVGLLALALLIPCFGLLSHPKIIWPLILTPLDLTALIIILESRAYRRWMTAYSVGWGRNNGG